MNNDVPTQLAALERAMADYDNVAIASCVAALNDLFTRAAETKGDAIDSAAAVHMLKLLRKRRSWDLLSASAEHLLRSGLRDPGVWMAYAQSLVDRGEAHPALELLKRVHTKHKKDKSLEAELRGRMGRTYKDMYMGLAGTKNPRRTRYLQRAVDEYDSVYQKDDTHRWHAINLVALTMRAKRDGIEINAPVKPKKLAQELVSAIEREWTDGRSNVWDAAIALEASVALGRREDAERWAGRYVSDPAADSFELGATLRQLREVWDFGDAGWEQQIIQLLRAKSLKAGDGAHVDVAAGDLENIGDIAGLEKVFGNDGIVTLKWYASGLERGRSVARIEDKSGNPIGTGFVVDAADLGDEEGGVVMMTNHHVMALEGLGVTPDRAIVAFDSFDPQQQRREFAVVAELLFSSPPDQCDTTIFRVEGEIDSLAAMPVASTKPERQSRIYAIGHPKGGTLSFSINDNLLLDYDDRRIHYRTPTEPGSSGSPVFNADWELIGIHHAGRDDMPTIDGTGTYQANEGIWISAVRAAMTS